MAARLLHAYVDVEEGPIEELSRVSLIETVESDEGTLPCGSKGTVVSVYGEGEAYCIEFTTPFNALITVSANQVTAISEATRERVIADASRLDRRSE